MMNSKEQSIGHSLGQRTFGRRTICRVSLVGGEREVWLITALAADDLLPDHPNLPKASAVVEWEGSPYWLLPTPDGTPLEQVLAQEGAAPDMAIARVQQLGAALCALQEAELLPGDFCRHVYWSDGKLVLDYPGALLDESAPSFPALHGRNEAEAAVITLAAILHSCYAGKPVTAPPHVFLPLDRFAGQGDERLQSMLTAGLDGAVSLARFTQLLSRLTRERRLHQLFPSRLVPSLSDGARILRTASRSGPGVSFKTRALDWGIWALCTGVGLYVLFIWA